MNAVQTRWLVVGAFAGLVVGIAAMTMLIPRLATVPGLAGPGAPIESFQRTYDPRQILVVALIGNGDQVIGSSVRETTETVTVIVNVQSPCCGPRTAEGYLVPVTVHLRDPLGDRIVLDPQGRQARDMGEYRAPMPTPPDPAGVGIVDHLSYTDSGGQVDLQWRIRGATETLASLRGKVVVISSWAANSNDAKLTRLAIEQYMDRLAPVQKNDIVLIYLNLGDSREIAGERERAATVGFIPLHLPPIVESDTTPAILRRSSAPVTWFIGPDGDVKHRVEGVIERQPAIANGIDRARQ